MLHATQGVFFYHTQKVVRATFSSIPLRLLSVCTNLNICRKTCVHGLLKATASCITFEKAHPHLPCMQGLGVGVKWGRGWLLMRTGLNPPSW